MVRIHNLKITLQIIFLNLTGNIRQLIYNIYSHMELLLIKKHTLLHLAIKTLIISVFIESLFSFNPLAPWHLLCYAIMEL